MKVGRSAHALLREQAKDLIKTYRPIADCEEAEYCINPEDDVEDQNRITHRKALTQMLDALEQMANSGSLAPPINFRRFSIREKYRAMLASGKTGKFAIAVLAEEFGTDQRSIERHIRVDPEQVAANALRKENAKAEGVAFAQHWASIKEKLTDKL